MRHNTTGVKVIGQKRVTDRGLWPQLGDKGQESHHTLYGEYS